MTDPKDVHEQVAGIEAEHHTGAQQVEVRRTARQAVTPVSEMVWIYSRAAARGAAKSAIEDEGLIGIGSRYCAFAQQQRQDIFEYRQRGVLPIWEC